MRNLNLLALCLLAFGFTAQSALAVSGTPGVPLPADVEVLLNSNAVPPTMVALGSQVTQKKVNVLKAVYDYSKVGGASGTRKLKDAAGGDAVLPKGAVVRQVLVDTVSALTSGGSATVAIGVNSTTDLKGALAYGSYTGILAGVPVGTAATAVKVTATSAVTATIAVAPLTAGKINVFIEYLLSE